MGSPKNGPKIAAAVALVVGLAGGARGDFEDAGLADGGSGSRIRCTITATVDVQRTDIFMRLHTCSSMNDYPGCLFKGWEQTGATRRAFVDRVEFDWSILPGERFYYGICQLCLIDWAEEWAEANPDLERCATSEPMLLGTTNGTPLPEQGLLAGVLASWGLLALLAYLTRRR